MESHNRSPCPSPGDLPDPGIKFAPPAVAGWRRQWHPTPVLLPGKSHGRRSLVGCSPWGRKESDMTERLDVHFSLSCIGEGNGSPLQCSCLENPRDCGAWWAAIYGVAQSWPPLKRRSSSGSGRWILYHWATGGVYSNSPRGARMGAWRTMNTGDKDTVIRRKERVLLWEGEVFPFFQFYVTGY